MTNFEYCKKHSEEVNDGATDSEIKNALKRWGFNPSDNADMEALCKALEGASRRAIEKKCEELDKEKRHD